MFDNDRSAYPHPDEFKVMRPEYIDPNAEPVEEGEEPAEPVEVVDGDEIVAVIHIAPFRVSGRSATRAGARRAALYEAAKTYRNYHPSYRIRSPFPDEFWDEDGTLWKRIPEHQRTKLGDYSFLLDGEDEDDYADIEQMLAWDVRPVPVYEDDE